MKNLTLILSLSVALMSVPNAFADTVHKEVDVTHNADGTYSGTANTEKTDAAGTTEKVTTKEKSAIKYDGTVARSAKTETSNDPKGLMNKTWSKKEVEQKVKADGETEATTDADSVDAAGTRHSVSASTTRERKADGTVETKTHEKVVTDPKGLMNKKTAESDSVERN